MIIEKRIPGYVIQVFDTEKNCFVEQRFMSTSINEDYYSHEISDVETLKKLMYGKGLSTGMNQPRQPSMKEGVPVDNQKAN